MKTRSIDKSIKPTITVVVLISSLLVAFGEDSTSTNAAAGTTSPDAVAEGQASAPTALSAGARDVLKLAQAKVSDNTIIAFINNSAANYSLNADEIVYFRQEGISDEVITAMLQHGNRQNNPAFASTENAGNSTNQTQVYALPKTTVVQTVPSTVYVYPDYPLYDDWWYPSLSLGFVFGGGWYDGGHYDWDDHSHGGGGSHSGGDGDHGPGGGSWGGASPGGISPGGSLGHGNHSGAMVGSHSGGSTSAAPRGGSGTSRRSHH